MTTLPEQPRDSGPSQDGPLRLEYAPALPWHRRPRLRRWITVAIVLITLAAAAKLTPPAWRHAQLLYWQKRCMTYTAPAEMVVWAPAERLGSHPEAWFRFKSLAPVSDIFGASTVLMHVRHTPHGEARLVHVTASPARVVPVTASSDGYGVVLLDVQTIRPGSSLRKPQVHFPFPRPLPIFYDDGTIRIFAGQPDPDDPSHFTIEYEVDGRRDIIDGWLMEDDVVKLQPRGEWRVVE